MILAEIKSTMIKIKQSGDFVFILDYVWKRKSIQKLFYRKHFMIRDEVYYTL